ncbi:MAG: hypothetical protein HY886_10380 [Deltaproteobacteria bacterium]|nr:hypothetical protein [Deltaproteobacteria bacterium]
MTIKKITFALLSLMALLLMSLSTQAAWFEPGEETKGAAITTGDTDLNIRVRLQPRYDHGNLVASRDNKTYSTESDLYLRRVRLELTGAFAAKTIKYNLTLSADKYDKAGNANALGIQTAFVEWAADPAFSIIAGKEKLPYSRVSLTSSSRRLLIENPVSTESAKAIFGRSEPYYQPKLAIKGAFLDGVIAYEAAYADGWANGDAIQTNSLRTTYTVYRSKPVYALRTEFSPPGWVESKKSDAHLGKGKHLTLGVDYVEQDDIEYNLTTGTYQESRRLNGIDLSGHYNGITAQIEYNEWKIDTLDPRVMGVHPRGWYAQAGYYIDGLRLEPVGRYEFYNQDSKAVSKAERDYTLGVNWYRMGHSLKFGVNWVRSVYQSNAAGRLANDDKKDVVQAQAQMYY